MIDVVCGFTHAVGINTVSLVKSWVSMWGKIVAFYCS